jgi:hypothetical protein
MKQLLILILMLMVLWQNPVTSLYSRLGFASPLCLMCKMNTLHSLHASWIFLRPKSRIAPPDAGPLSTWSRILPLNQFKFWDMSEAPPVDLAPVPAPPASDVVPEGDRPDRDSRHSSHRHSSSRRRRFAFIFYNFPKLFYIHFCWNGSLGSSANVSRIFFCAVEVAAGIAATAAIVPAIALVHVLDPVTATDLTHNSNRRQVNTTHLDPSRATTTTATAVAEAAAEAITDTSVANEAAAAGPANVAESPIELRRENKNERKKKMIKVRSESYCKRSSGKITPNFALARFICSLDLLALLLVMFQYSW